MKGKKFQKYANIHQQFKPLPPAPLKKLNGIKTSTLNTGKELPYMQLEKVIGMSSRNNSSIAINPINGEIASTAGCVICIYNAKENKQTRFLFSRLQRSFSCLTYSHNGKYFAAGEGAFRQPEITIWEISLDNQYTEIKHLKGHKYGIEAILFSPNLNYLLSLGDANDRGLFVWDWENEQRVTSNKLGKPVNTFAFSERGDYFVTAGFQHLKYWYFDEMGRVQKTESGGNKESIMESKTADLTKVIVKIFVGVSCHNQMVYALAQDGNLYVYDKMRTLKKWMNIKVEKAFTCTISNGYIFCGCSDGFIRVFMADTLSHKVTLPKPPPLGQANIEAGVKKIRIPSSKESKFADILAVIVDDINKRAIVLYSDRMMFIWDIKELDRISVLKSNMFHCGPIHDIQYLPNSMEFGFKDENAAVQMQEEQAITRFMTCSSDRTIRFWHFIDPTASSQTHQQIGQCIVKNAYCKDMSRMIYVNSENRDRTVGQYDHFKVRAQRMNEDGTVFDQQATLSPDEKDIEQQVRCVRISPDGKHVACGDWTGNIRVHDVRTLEEIQCIQAHESEVLCLDYSPIIDLQNNNSQQNTSDNQQQMLQLTSTIKYWLASGSRDRLTQIYELSQESGVYENVTILEDHSSTLTSLKFAEETSTKNQKRLKLISTGADKQIVLRNIDLNVVQQNDVRKLQNMTTEEFMVVQKKEQCKYKSFCMDIAHQAGYIVTGHDRFIQMFSLSGCDKVMEKRIESSRKSGSMDQIRVLIDQNAGVVLSSSTDKYVTIYEAATGNVICRTTCGEVTTAMCLSTNMKHLITTSTDGIIYIWRLPENLQKALLLLKQEQKRKEAQIFEDIDRGISIATDINNQQLINQPPINNGPSVLGGNAIKSGEIQASADDDFNDLENIAGISSMAGYIDKKHPGQKNEQVRMSEVLAQISKATGQIDKIQLRNAPNVNNILEEKDEEQIEDEKQQKAQIKDDNDEDGDEFDFGLGTSPKDKASSQQNQQLDSSSPSLESSQNNSQSTININQQRKNRVNWATKQKPAPQENSNISAANSGDATSQQQLQQIDEEQIRQMKVKENKLPRWAQSVTGDIFEEGSQQRNTLAQRMSKQSKNDELEQIKNQIMQQLSEDDTQLGINTNKTLVAKDPQAVNSSPPQDNDIEEVFQNTLDRANSNEINSDSQNDGLQKITQEQSSSQARNGPDKTSVSAGVGMQSNVVVSQGGGAAGVPRNAFYERIEEDLDEDKKSNDESRSLADQDEDDEEKQIKEQLQRRQVHKSRILLGLEDEEDPSGDLNQQRLRMRNNESRTSLSQQFFQRKLGTSSEQNLFKGQNLTDMVLIQNQYNQRGVGQQPSQQSNQGKREVLKVEDIFNDNDNEPYSTKQTQQLYQKQINPQQATSKMLQQSQSQFINQTSQLINPVKQQQQKLQPNQLNYLPSEKQKIDQDLNQLSQQSDLRKLAQDKYEQHKKLLEEEYKKKQKDIEEQLLKEKDKMEAQHILRKSQLETQEREKLTQMEQLERQPQIKILEEIESEIKREDERLANLNNKISGGDELRNASHLSVQDSKIRGASSRSGSRQSRSPRYQQDNVDEEESIVQIRQEPKGNNVQGRLVDEAAVNATIKTEMDRINNSLAKITQCLNNTGQATSINNALRVKDDVAETLSRSMGLWNSMMLSLSNRTSINVNLLQSQQMSSFSQSQSYGVASGANSAVNQSFLSQVSVKDDARDLLQKYSDLLLEEVAKKLSKK